MCVHLSYNYVWFVNDPTFPILCFIQNIFMNSHNFTHTQINDKMNEIVHA